MVSNFNNKKSLPRSLQGVLWSRNINNFNLQKDKAYIAHQVLSFGSLEQIKWLLALYGKSAIKNVFLQQPSQIYQPAVFYFVKNFILGLGNKNIPAKKYVKTKLPTIN